jgi:[acyl-carrier-protein] S-malonyltransferase
MVDLMAAKTAVIFPGQGSQFLGMGKDFFDVYPLAKETFKEANSILGYDITRLCFDGPIEELNLTQNTQPAILTVSTAILRVVEQETALYPELVAGHSLGEYTALVAAGALSFADALRLVYMRGKFMQEAVPDGVGAMAAFLGLGVDVVKEICEDSAKTGSLVVPANINSPEQIVISGDNEAVKRASKLAKERGARRVVILPVSVPSHSPLMKEAAERFALEVNNVSFARPKMSVICNVDAELINSGGRIKELLVRQLYSPVQWVATIRRMVVEKIELIVGVGPGKVLTGLIKRIDQGIRTINIDKPEDISILKKERMMN